MVHRPFDGGIFEVVHRAILEGRVQGSTYVHTVHTYLCTYINSKYICRLWGYGLTLGCADKRD